MIPYDAILKYNDHEVAFREVAGIGLAMRRGELFEVEGVGLDILQEIRQKSITCSELCETLTKRYRVPLEKVSSDVSQFVQELYSCRLILIPEIEKKGIDQLVGFHLNDIPASSQQRSPSSNSYEGAVSPLLDALRT